MKRCLFGVVAIIMSVSAVAFTSPKNDNTNVATVYWQFNGGDPLDINNYSQITSTQFAALNCSSGNKMCGIQTNTISPTLEPDSKGFPLVNGTVLESDKKP